MATHAPITGAPSRASSEYLDDASCWLEQAGGIADLIAAVGDDSATTRASYAIRSLVEYARDAIAAAQHAAAGRA